MKKKILALLLSLALVLPFIGGLTVPAEAAGNKLIAITFDDGPGNFTGSLLDGLASRGVPALASDAQLLYYACLPLSHCFLERLKINTFVILTCNSHFPDKLLTLQPQPLKEGFDASLFQQALSNSECSST